MLDRNKIPDAALLAVLGAFKFEGSFKRYASHGCGHINDTFLFTFGQEDGKELFYILQRINRYIFKDVPRLMRNFELVTDFLGKKAEEAGIERKRGALTLIYAKDGKSYIESEDGFFRAFVFIDRATSYQCVSDPKLFYEAGRAFGRFAALLDGFDAGSLYESIPDFHDTEKRYENFLKALDADPAGRAKNIEAEAAFTTARKNITCLITSPLKSLEIPFRVTHNDTKLNNVMIDDETLEAAAVIDLDTVMPGSLLYDFGDSIRSGCNTAAEDEKDLSKVGFDFGLFSEYSRGYLKEAGGLIERREKELLAFAPMVMTFECGMRFLTDYLDGDKYFKTKYPEHNLDRARTQYKLVGLMEKNLDKMQKILQSIPEYAIK